MNDAQQSSISKYFLPVLLRCTVAGVACVASPARGDMSAETGRELLNFCEVDYDRCSENVAWTIGGIQVGIMGTLGLQFGDTSLTEVMHRKAYQTLYGCRPAGLSLHDAAHIVIRELRSDRSLDLLNKLPAASILFALGRSFPCP